MTSTVKNIKVGNISYPVQDTKATPFLSSVDEATLLSDGVYRGETVANGTIFTKPDGTFYGFSSSTGAPTLLYTAGAMTSGAWDLAYSDGVFVGVSAYNSSKTCYSTDGGVTWLTSTLPSSNAWAVATNGEGLWVAARGSGANGAYSTDNGVTWTAATSGGAIRTIGHVRYGNGVFIAVGYDGIQYTTDGITWTGVSQPTSYGYWDVFYDEDRSRFVLYNMYTGYVYSSTTGSSFSILGTLPFAPNCNDTRSQLLCKGGEVMLAVKPSDRRVARSQDGGATWTELTKLPMTDEWGYLYYFNGAFFLSAKIGSSSRAVLMSQDNGDSWTILRKAWTNLAYSCAPLLTDDAIIYYSSRGNYSNTAFVSCNILGSTEYALTQLSYDKDAVDIMIPEGYLADSGAPSISTEAEIGQRYFDTTNGDTYVCTGTEIGSSTAYYTTVGYPTVSGSEVSNFGDNNYLIGPTFTWASSTSSRWSIECKFTTAASTNSSYRSLFSIRYGSTENRLCTQGNRLIFGFTTYGTGSATNANYTQTLETSTTYKAKIEYTGTGFNMYCVVDGYDYPEEPLLYTTTVASLNSSAVLYIGKEYPTATQSYFTGSIDMSSFIIKSNGVEVWRGADATPIEYQWKQLANKDEAGIPVLLSTTDPSTTTVGLLGQRLLNTVSGSSFVCKGVYVPEEYIPNYTVNGNPTISSAQVLSNCSASNYITGSQLFNCATSSSSAWAIETEITLPSGSLSGRQHYMAIGTGDHVLIQEGSWLYWSMANWGVSFESSNMRHSVTAGKTYTMRMEYDGTSLNWYISDDGTIPSTPTHIYSRPGSLASGNSIFFGCRPAYSSQYAQGSINLLKTKIYAAGDLYWEAVTSVEEVPAEWVALGGGGASYTAGTGIAIDSDNVISNTGLINTATGTDSLTILGSASTDSDATNVGKGSYSGIGGVAVGRTASAGTYSVAVGKESFAYGGDYATAIGGVARATAERAIAVGYGATASASHAIQIGRGSNSTANTMNVGLSSSLNVQLLDSSGNIPAARLSNIYEVVQTLPASPTAGKIYFVTGSTT